MADNGQNAYLEAAFHGQAPHAFGEKAPEVHLNRSVMERGMAEGRGASAPHVQEASARGGRRGTLGESKESGDPAVTGDFQTNPYAGTGLISNMIYGAGKLSENGQRQKADYDVLQQGQRLYAQALMQGATQEQAAQHTLASMGQNAVPFLSALMSHPSSPLASASAFHNFLAGNGMSVPTEAYGNPDKTTGQQLVFDPTTGKVTGVNQAPQGFISPEQTKSDNKFEKPIIKQDKNGNYAAIDPKNPSQALPIATVGPNGPQQFTGPLTAKQQAASNGTIPGADGLGPQVPTTGVPTGSKSEDRLTMRQLPAIASAVGLMEDIKQKASGVMGVVRGPLAQWVGQYAGANPVAASIKADMDNLNSLSSALQGSVYAGAIKSMQESYAGSNDAPTFVRTQLTKTQDMLRSQGQAAADNIGQTRGVAVPQQLANQLEGAGIIPLGYQTESEFQKLGPQATGEWKLRNGFQNNITPDERKAVYEAAQSGAYGPAPDPSKPIASQAVEPMAGHVFNMYQQSQAQKKAQAQQQAAPQAAADATKANQVKATADGAAQATQQAAQEMAQPAQPETINPPREGEAAPQETEAPQKPQGDIFQGHRMMAPPGSTNPPPPQDLPTPEQVNQAVSTQATQGAQQPAAAAAAPSVSTPQPAPAPIRNQPTPAPAIVPQATSGTDAQGNPYATAPITPYQPPAGSGP